MQYDIKRGRNSITEYTQVRYKEAQGSLSLSLSLPLSFFLHFLERHTRLPPSSQRFIETSLGDRVVCLRRNCSNSISDPPHPPPMLSKTEFAIKFAGSDSVLGNAVSKRSLSWLIHRSNAIFIWFCLLSSERMSDIRWMVF